MVDSVRPEMWDGLATRLEGEIVVLEPLISLDAAGLIERRSGHVIASEVARRLDQMIL